MDWIGYVVAVLIGAPCLAIGTLLIIASTQKENPS